MYESAFIEHSDNPADKPDVVLSIAPSNIMPVTGTKNQIIHTYDDEGISVVGISDKSSFTVQLQWDYLSEEDHIFILDMYHNPEKANGAKNTIYWVDPLALASDPKFIIRLLTPLTTKYAPHLIQSVDVMTIKIEGKEPV